MYIYVLYVCGVMLSVRTQDGDCYQSLCVLVCVYLFCVCVCVCVVCNVVGRDRRCNDYHSVCVLVCISVVYVCGIMLLVRTQDGDRFHSLCVCMCVV